MSANWFLYHCLSAPNQSTPGEHPKNASDRKDYIKDRFSLVNIALNFITQTIFYLVSALNEIKSALNQVVQQINELGFYSTELLQIKNELSFLSDQMVQHRKEQKYFSDKLVYSINHPDYHFIQQVLKDFRVKTFLFNPV